MHIVIKMAKLEVKKKEWQSYMVSVDIPQGVSIVYNSPIVTVKGEKGENSKQFRYPQVEVLVEVGKVIIKTDKLTKRQKKVMHTYRAHLDNMIKGVQEGFEYKLKVVYAKFPMTIEIKDNTFFVKNFLGQKVPRKVKLDLNVNVKINDGKEVIVTGVDKEKCGQMAASIEQLTRINHLDRRVIQDGIYITEKPHMRYS